MSQNYIVHENVVYKEILNPLFRTYTKVNIPVTKPKIEWLGTKIPFSLWREFVAWCQLSYTEFKSETMVFFYYSEATSEWSMWIVPQKTSGMTVKSNPEDSSFNEQRKAYPDLMLGTGHHHCSTSAFQSGTDHSDEISKEGIHFTLGNVGAKEHTVHVRISLGGLCQDCEMADVIDAPSELKLVPSRYLRTIVNEMCKEPIDAETLKVSYSYLSKSFTQVSKPEPVAWGNRNYNNSSYSQGLFGKWYEEEPKKKNNTIKPSIPVKVKLDGEIAETDEITLLSVLSKIEKLKAEYNLNNHELVYMATSYLTQEELPEIKLPEKDELGITRLLEDCVRTISRSPDMFVSDEDIYLMFYHFFPKDLEPMETYYDGNSLLPKIPRTYGNIL